MVNGLHLCSAFTDPMATKMLYILPHIHSFIHRRHQPCKVSSSSSGAAGVRCLVNGHLDTWSGGTGDWTTNLPVCRKPAWTHIHIIRCILECNSCFFPLHILFQSEMT